MHIEPSEQKQAMAAVTAMLARGGMLAITLRKGPDSANRGFYPVTVSELHQQILDNGLVLLASRESRDCLGREDVSWNTSIACAHC